MSDDVQNLATFMAAIGLISNLIAVAITPIALGAVAYAAIPRHPPPQMVPRAGPQRNTPVAAIPPSGANLEQANLQQAHTSQANHRVHLEDPIVALPHPSPPPNYLEHPRDPRIDGVVPSYSNPGSPRGRPVDVVPLPNRNPPQENANFDRGEGGGRV
ncbi:hypothetical protein FRC00_000667 [Tulasnella sp. 408]|nr:hypothetical protein FRC00_000667 [Tulasnella sp. 408]